MNNVTVLYADIVGFTNWSSNKSPTEIVGKLSELFKKFDLLCVKYNVYKVHTIGDCYVVLGINSKNIEERDIEQECMNTVNMAFAMLDVIKEVNIEQGIDLNMRIGLHTGTVIAGITGTNIVRYDIYGSDATLANKMESGGQAGRINVSEVTKAIVEKVAPAEF
jgi:class 3 adenylate cyclase